ncbi:MAG TPA: hypothetical protein DDW42_04540 [Desulfobacteraceae bacterium]|nr:hypothetical protein [Desulfobacteraceae bacterium]
MRLQYPCNVAGYLGFEAYNLPALRQFFEQVRYKAFSDIRKAIGNISLDLKSFMTFNLITGRVSIFFIPS